MGAYVCTVLVQVYHLHSVKSDDNGTEAASLKKNLSKRKRSLGGMSYIPQMSEQLAYSFELRTICRMGKKDKVKLAFFSEAPVLYI